MSATAWLRVVATYAVAVLTALVGVGTGTSFRLPQRIPPAAGDPVPDIVTHAHGRPTAQLRTWAQEPAAALRMPLITLEVYAHAAKVAEGENPHYHPGWTTWPASGRSKGTGQSRQRGAVGGGRPAAHAERVSFPTPLANATGACW